MTCAPVAIFPFLRAANLTEEHVVYSDCFQGPRVQLVDQIATNKYLCSPEPAKPSNTVTCGS